MRLPLTNSTRRADSAVAATGFPRVLYRSAHFRYSSADWRRDGLRSNTKAFGSIRAVCNASAADTVDLPDCREHRSNVLSPEQRVDVVNSVFCHWSGT